MVPYKGFGPLKKAEGMAPILTIIVKFRESICSPEAGKLDRALRINRFQTAVLAVEDNCGIGQTTIDNQAETGKY